MEINKWYSLSSRMEFAIFQFEKHKEFVGESLRKSKENPRLLAVVSGSASNAARLIWALKQDKQQCLDYFRLSCDARYWNYKTVREAGRQMVTLHGHAPFEVQGPAERHWMMHFSSWYQGIEEAAIFRRHDVIEEMLKVPEEFLFGGGVDWGNESAVKYRFVKAFWTNDPDLPEIYKKLLEVLDPAKYKDEDDLFKLMNYSLPMAELYGRIMLRDQQGFDETLVEVLEGMLQLSAPRPGRDANIYNRVPTYIIAAAVIARDRGMQINIETPYIPKWMLEGDF